MKVFLSLLLLVMSAVAAAEGVHEFNVDDRQTVILSWNAPTTNVENEPLKPGDIKGYRVYSGTSRDELSLEVTMLPDVLFYEPKLVVGARYYAVTALGARGVESDFSVIKEVIGYAPKPRLSPVLKLEVK